MKSTKKIIQLKTKKLLEIPLSLATKDDILQYLLQVVTRPGENSVISLSTPNPEQVVYAHHHQWYKKLLQSSEISIPDGVGDSWAMRFLYQQSIERIAGIDMMASLIKFASDNNLCIAYLGGRAGSAEQTMKKFAMKYPSLAAWSEELEKLEIDDATGVLARQNGKSISEYYQKIAEKIVTKHTTIIYVGLGAPKQELFIQGLRQALRVRHLANSVILMSVGGSFDELSGKVKMPPTFISDAGLKWLWRLILEPWRLKRQLAIPEFIGLVLKEKLFPSDTV